MKRQKQDSMGRDIYRMHYMTVRRMYFTDGWPVFSPEPYAGEDGRYMTYQEWEKGKDIRWEWLRFPPLDNRQVRAARAPLPENADRTKLLVFPCYDFENSRETMALSGLTEDGCALWGKAVETGE